MALIGWLQHGQSPGDAIFKTLGVLSAGGDYAESGKWPGNWWIAVARWFGFAFFLLTAKKALGLMLSHQFADLSAQWGSHQIVLIGDHPDFSDLVDVVRRRRSVLWLGSEKVSRRPGVRVVPRQWTPALIDTFGLCKADRVVIGYGSDDMQTVGVAKAFAARSPAGETLVLSSELSAHEGLQALDGLRGARLVSPEKAIARSLHEAFPPFEIAQRSGHDRIHALLVGCGEMGEQILRDLVLSSLTTFLGMPRVTIVDPRAHEIVTSLKVRAPEIERSIELEPLVPAGQSDTRAYPVTAMAASAAAAPFTLAYVCLADDRAALAAAFALERLSAREAWQLDTIFVRQRSSHADGTAGDAQRIGTLVPFGTPEQLAIGLGLLGGGTDRIACEIHEAYRAFAPAEAVASLSWDELPADLRDANRALLMHLPGKLASAGIRFNPAEPDLTALAALRLDGDLLERLARLEHDRWMAQRRLSGWQYGPVRDNMRRLHPDLIPFDELSEAARDKDRDMIRTLARVLSKGRAH